MTLCILHLVILLLTLFRVGTAGNCGWNVDERNDCPSVGSTEWNCLKTRRSCFTPLTYHCGLNSEKKFVEVCAAEVQCKTDEEPQLPNKDGGTITCIQRKEDTKAEVVYLRADTAKMERIYKEGLPDMMQFHFSHTEGQLLLRLQKNKHLNPYADVYTEEVDDVGNFKAAVSDSFTLGDTMFDFYQDLKNNGYFTMECRKTVEYPCVTTIKGNLRIGKQEYSLEPKDDADIKRETPSSLGIPHILKILPRKHVQFADEVLTDKRTVGDDFLHHENDVKQIIENRKKRAPTAYDVELLVVVDYPLYHKFQLMYGENPEREVIKFIVHLVNGADMRYSSIREPDMSIFLTISGFVIAKTPAESPWTGIPGRRRTTKSILKKLEYWYYSTTGLPEHDHTTLFTGNDIVGMGDPSTRGVAMLEGMCSELSFSVVEFYGFFEGSFILAHEIGHGLGARHDGQTGACQARENFVMAPFVPDVTPESTSTNYWKFSECSIASFRNHILRLDRTGRNCLLNKGRIWDEDEWESMMTEATGKLYTLSEQCDMLHGANTTLCVSSNATNICRRLRCQPDPEGTCYSSGVRNHAAAPGTPCGERSMCLNGFCVGTQAMISRDDGSSGGGQPTGISSSPSSTDFMQTLIVTVLGTCITMAMLGLITTR